MKGRSSFFHRVDKDGSRLGEHFSFGLSGNFGESVGEVEVTALFEICVIT